MLNRYLIFRHQIYDLNVIDRNVIEAFSTRYSRISHYDKKIFGRYYLSSICGKAVYSFMRLGLKMLWEGLRLLGFWMIVMPRNNITKGNAKDRSVISKFESDIGEYFL